jgi:hypothetical protein
MMSLAKEEACSLAFWSSQDQGLCQLQIRVSFYNIRFVPQVARVGVKAKPIWLFAEKINCNVYGYGAIEKIKIW